MKPGIETQRIFQRPAFKYYFWQLLGATAFILLVLFVMDTMSSSHLIWAVGASSLASSAYVVFMHPHGIAAKPKNIFLAYTLAVCVGEIIRIIMIAYGLSCHIPENSLMTTGHNYWFAAAISVSAVMIIMAIFDIEHPPASGIALVLVVELCRHHIVELIYVFMLLLCVVQLICRSFMKNLLR